MNLRKLQLSDAEQVFKWRNDPELQKLGSLQKPVEWQEHLAWIEQTVNTNKRKAFIITENYTPCGQIRFDSYLSEDMNLATTCVVSIYILQQYTGKGDGIKILKDACVDILKTYPNIKEILAFVREDNLAGQKAFPKAGFKQSDAFKTPDKHQAYVYAALD